MLKLKLKGRRGRINTKSDKKRIGVGRRGESMREGMGRLS